jgi:putative copper export protein
MDGDPWTPMVGRILSTSWGHAALWQAAAAFIAAQGFWTAGRGKAHGWVHAVVGALVLSIVPAFMGHAGAIEKLRAIGITADVVHVLAAGAWAGGLAMLTIAAWRERDNRDGGEGVATLIDRFHGLAKGSVGALAMTGVVSGVYHLRAWAELTGTDYGRILLVKLACVAIAVWLGWRHSKTGANLARTKGAAAVSGTLTTEWAMMVLVLMLTGLLTGSPPPGTE